jgi:hypothetical protein
MFLLALTAVGFSSEDDYFNAAMVLQDLPDDDLPVTRISPWERDLGRALAGKFALSGLRIKRDRVGDVALTAKEQQALHLYAQYEAGDKSASATQDLLDSSRAAALDALEDIANSNFGL